jgi:hypothetical protein
VAPYRPGIQQRRAGVRVELRYRKQRRETQ